MARRVAGTEENKVNCSSIRCHARPRWMGPMVLASVLVIFGFFTCGTASAQAISRKLKNRVEPVYPELAKRNNISGSARVELLITPEGRVKDVKVLGGNPVLVQAVIVAVMKWKYEPAAAESTVVIKFDFSNP
jgi:TonB family protein